MVVVVGAVFSRHINTEERLPLMSLNCGIFSFSPYRKFLPTVASSSHIFRLFSCCSLDLHQHLVRYLLSKLRPCDTPEVAILWIVFSRPLPQRSVTCSYCFLLIWVEVAGR